MRSIIFDSGPVISLTVNNLLWILEALKDRYNGEYIIPTSVKKELIDVPLATKKFKFESLQVLDTIRRDIVIVHEDNNQLKNLTEELLKIANSCYYTGKEKLKIIHYAEMEVIALALLQGADAIVVDERMTRAIIENPDSIPDILSRKYHTKVNIDKNKIKELKNRVGDIKFIRSCELAMVAYENGLFEKYLPKKTKIVKKPRKILLQAVLWALKLHGCAVSHEEIDQLVKIELKL